MVKKLDTPWISSELREWVCKLWCNQTVDFYVAIKNLTYKDCWIICGEIQSRKCSVERTDSL